MTPKTVQRNYLVLTLLNTLAASFIWGINTLFLLDAGLTNTEAFAANAFFTLGMMTFEVPTGVIADTMGRRTSYLIGTLTLLISTLLYLTLWKFQWPFWTWALTSVFLGLGFTFFSGAVEAWLVDALQFSGYQGSLEDVFAKGQVASGSAMLFGSAFGGYLAQQTNLGVPYLLRCLILVASFILASLLMKDLGFQPRKVGRISKEVKTLLKTSIDSSLRQPYIRWAMLISPFLTGVGIYGFYAAQPFLLEIYGDKSAYSLAGVAAALVALSQIVGGLSVPYFRRFFLRRSSIMFMLMFGSMTFLFLLGFAEQLWTAIAVLGFWALLGAAMNPIRQAYLNKCIDSDKRATVLSFDGLMGSTGGVVIQPILGRAADIWGYSLSFIIAASIQLLALPFVLLIRKEKAPADIIDIKGEN